MTIRVTTAAINVDDLPKWRGLEGPAQVLLLDWCKEHCQAAYEWEGMEMRGQEYMGYIRATIGFQDAADAAAFKLRWG